jgi:serine/threonine-protein kinase
MGVVVRVTHLHLGEELALKILLKEATTHPDVTARFLREAQSAARLRGEHVTRVSDVGLLPDGVPYIAMEYLRGVDLSAELGRRRLFPGEAVDYMLQACEALAEAHVHDIVHRDIKPSNLFLTTRPDGTPLIKVLDFGISKTAVAKAALVTKTDIVMGTPGYMSPEQMKASRAVDARSDIWSLGIVLYECLCGRRPFEAESFSAVVLMAGTEPPPPMDPRLPRGLQAVVLRCLEKDRAARFPSIAALAAALAPFAHDQRAAAIIVERANLMLRRAGGQVIEAPGVPVPALRETTLRSSAGVSGVMASQTRRRLIWGALAVGAIALGSVLAAIGSTRGQEPPKGISVIPGVGTNSALIIEASGSAVPISSKPGASGSAEVRTPPGGGPTSPGTVTADATVANHADSAADTRAQQIGRCTDLMAAHDWQALRDCAGALDERGVTDKAAAFKETALTEQDNERKANTVRQLIRAQKLKEAQAQLAKIGDSSVYHRQVSEELTRAETTAIDGAVRTARALADAHDCAGLRTQYKQLVQSSTARVAGAIAAIKCTEKVAQGEPSPRGNAPPAGTANPVGGTAVTQPPPPPPLVIPPPPTSGCSAKTIDELMEQAAHQYTAGFSRIALSAVVKALACKQDLRMYRIAAMYACAARDLAAAKLYFNKLPQNLQSPIVQRCQQEDLDLHVP